MLRDELRKCVRSNSDEDRLEKAMILNFYWPKLGVQHKPWGHISVAAAYHEETDRVLVLDVSPSSKSAWYSMKDMCEALSVYDKRAQNHRGFIVVSKK